MRYNWKDVIKSLFGIRPTSKESYIAVEEAKKEPEPVIGEPVLSFVALVKNNPKRFEVKGGYVGYNFRINLLDLQTKENFWCEIQMQRLAGTHYDCYDYITVYSGSPSFLTQDEWYYVNNELTTLRKDLKARQERVNAYKEQKIKNKERQRLIDVYCTK